MSSTFNIWNLLVSSGLVPASGVAELRTHCEGDLGSSEGENPQSILGWLRDQKRISVYQMRVLGEGQPGPFCFEQYRVHAINAGGPLDGSFRARHVGTNHPVRIYFFGGSDPDDAKTWAGIRKFASPLHQIHSPFVGRCFEVVEDGEYRFVVFEDQPGKTLTEKLPYKSRLPWPQTLQAIELLALGLTEIHRAGYAHGRIWPGAIWLLRGGICQLLWQIPNLNFDPLQPADMARIPTAFQAPALREYRESVPDIEQLQRADLFSLGALAFRLVSGKPPKIKATDLELRNAEVEKHIAFCEKYELPENVARLMRLLLTADVSKNLKNADVTAKLTGTILESQSIKMDVEPAPATLAAYEETLNQKNRSKGFLDTLETIDGSRLANVPHPTNDGAPNFDDVSTTHSNLSARDRLARRQNKKRNRLPMLLAGSILAGAVIIGAVLGGVFSPKDASIAGSDKENLNSVDESANAGEDSENTEPDKPAEVEPVAFRPQIIINDNDEMPWESPTGAQPIDVKLMPAAPEFLLVLRPRRLGQNEQATRFLQSLGPRFQELSERFCEQAGVQPAEIERLNLSLHNGSSGTYEFAAIVELVNPVLQDELWQRTGKPSITDDAESGFTTFQLESHLLFFEPNEEETVSTFGFGKAAFLTESFESMGLAMAGRTMTRLIERSDRDRDVTLIFRNAALLSEEGKWLFSGNFASLRRPLSLFFDDRMEGIKLSLHFDEGSYLEWMSEQTTDLTNDELVEWLPQKFESTRDQLTGFVSKVPPHPYWAPVQQRFDNMLNELVKQIRVGRERDGVVANCWLPEVAPHNLVTAGELVLNGTGFGSEEEITETGPANLEQLLQTPRDLTVASDPDLINLLSAIEQEIKDDFPKLPFEFRIRLLGGDLAVEGITQNQRPGNFTAKQKPLGEILAQIMFQANSDKSATSPADEKCKLVWLIGPDPDDPATQAVLVTTRKAASEKNLSLPDIFRSE